MGAGDLDALGQTRIKRGPDRGGTEADAQVLCSFSRVHGRKRATFRKYRRLLPFAWLRPRGWDRSPRLLVALRTLGRVPALAAPVAPAQGGRETRPRRAASVSRPGAGGPGVLRLTTRTFVTLPAWTAGDTETTRGQMSTRERCRDGEQEAAASAAAALPGAEGGHDTAVMESAATTRSLILVTQDHVPTRLHVRPAAHARGLLTPASPQTRDQCVVL